MGRKFGAIGRLKNVVTYSLSPFEQRAFAGFQKSLANFVRRVRWQLPYQIPPVIIGVLIYNWGTNDFIQRNRKNPKDYENDVWTLFFNCLGFHYLSATYSAWCVPTVAWVEWTSFKERTRDLLLWCVKIDVWYSLVYIFFTWILNEWCILHDLNSLCANIGAVLLSIVGICIRHTSNTMVKL